MILRTSQKPQVARTENRSRAAKYLLQLGCTLACCLTLTAGRTAIAQSTDAASATAPEAITPNGSVVEDIIVRVNDQIITRSDLERAQEQLDQETQGRGLSDAEVADRQKNLLRDLIDQQLLLSKGKELDINADAETITQLDEIRKQNHFATMEELQKAAEQSGVSFEDFKANIRNNIISQEVVRDEVGRKLQFSQADAKAYYDAHQADFTQPETVKLSEILIATPAPEGQMPDDATVAKAQTKADEVAAKLKSGASFDEVAKTSSDGPTADQGGDLGEFKRGALAKELEDATFSLPVGGVTAPIRTRQGFVILKVTAHTQAGVQPLADVEDQVEQAVYMQQMQPALRAYLTQLREDAFVDIKPGFIDTGASPKQTKPVFTAYAPPAPKKKKTVVAKERYDRHGHVIPASTPAAAPAAATAATASAKAKPVVLAKNGKPEKIKREKIRYGQAPRETLPEAAKAGTATPATEVGSAQSNTSLMAEALPDPNVTSTTPDTITAPDTKPRTKTRYAQRPEAPKAPKVKKVLPAPAPATSDETAAQKVQSAPLGLNGDTAKKKKTKTKHTGPKERLTDKDKNAAAASSTQPATTPAPAATPAPNPQQ